MTIKWKAENEIAGYLLEYLGMFIEMEDIRQRHRSISSEGDMKIGRVQNALTTSSIYIVAVFFEIW